MIESLCGNVYPTNNSTEGTFLQDFLVILKRMHQNYWKFSEKYFLGGSSNYSIFNFSTTQFRVTRCKKVLSLLNKTSVHALVMIRTSCSLMDFQI